MKTQNLLFIPTVAFFTFAIVLGCKKQEQLAPENAPVVMQDAVKEWHDDFMLTATKREQVRADEIVKNLDYNLQSQIALGDTARLLLVGINEIVNNSATFLGIVLKKGNYTIDGIYSAKELSTIENFYKNKSLPAKESIVVNSLNNTPVKAWQMTSSGRIRYKRGMGVPKTSNVSTNSVRLNLIDPNYDPFGGPCIAWFWVIYSPITGQSYYSEFLYTTGNCEGIYEGAQGGAPDPECYNAYDDQAANFEAISSGAYEVDDQNNTEYTTAPDPDDPNPNDPVTKIFEDEWLCLYGDSYWGLFSIVSGKLRKKVGVDNFPDHPWVWKRLAHQGIIKRGSLMPGTTITWTNGFSTVSFTDETADLYNVYAAVLQLKFSVTYTYRPFGNCPVAKDIIEFFVPPVTKNYTSRCSWSL